MAIRWSATGATGPNANPDERSLFGGSRCAASFERSLHFCWASARGLCIRSALFQLATPGSSRRIAALARKILPLRGFGAPRPRFSASASGAACRWHANGTDRSGSGERCSTFATGKQHPSPKRLSLSGLCNCSAPLFHLFSLFFNRKAVIL